MPVGQDAVSVTVADSHLPEIHKLADSLRSKGMTVERVLPVMGVISGYCSADCLSDLESVAGVASVNRESYAPLPPPGSPQQ